MIALLVTLIAILLLLFRVPVGFALIIPSLGYIVLATNISITAAIERMTSALNSFPLLAVPLFIFVGAIANSAGLSERIFDAAHAVVGRVRGGLAYVNVLSSLGFSWMSGSAASDVAVLGKVLVPQMKRHGYSNKFTAGITASASLVSPIMPPSIPAIMFGVASGVSIGALFIAAVVPALLLTVVLLASVWIYVRAKNVGTDHVEIRGRRRVVALKALPIAFAPVIVLGGILGGFFTPTEAAAVAAAFLLFLGLVVYRSLNWMGIVAALKDTFGTSASILFLVAASALFGWVLTMERVPQVLAQLILGLTEDPTVFLLIMLAVLFLIGMFMEPVSAVLITTPVLYPIGMQLGVDPVHFGVVLVFALLTGLFTPPIGLVLFILEAVTDLKGPEVITGVLPYVAIFIVFALLLILVPGISLWLPGLIG